MSNLAQWFSAQGRSLPLSPAGRELDDLARGLSPAELSYALTNARPTMSSVREALMASAHSLRETRYKALEALWREQESVRLEMVRLAEANDWAPDQHRQAYALGVSHLPLPIGNVELGAPFGAAKYYGQPGYFSR